MKPRISLLAAALFLTGCASQRYVPMTGQRIIRSEGSMMVLSQGEIASVTIGAVSILEGKGRFVFSVLNQTDRLLIVNPRQMSALTEAGRPATFYSGAELVGQAEERFGAKLEAVASRAACEEGEPPSLSVAPEVLGPRAASRLAMIGERFDDDLREASHVMKPAAVPPGGVHSAVVIVKAARQLHFTLALGRERHTARFALRH